MDMVVVGSLLVCFAAFLVILAGACFEYSIKSPVVLIYAAAFVMFLVPTIVESAVGGDYPGWVYLEAAAFGFIYVSFFFMSRKFFVAFFRLRSGWADGFINHGVGVGRPDGTAIFLFFSISAFLLLVVGLELFSVDKALSLNWWDLVQSGSPVVLVGTYATYCSAPLFVLAFLQKKSYPVVSKISFLFGVFFVLFAIFILKTRSYVLIFLAPFFLFVFYKKGFRRSAPLVFFAVFVVFLFVLTRAVRHAENLSEFLDLGMAYFFGGAASGAETDFVQAFYYYIYHHNDFDGFGQNITLKRIVFFWVPQSFGWVKPPDFSYYMHSAYYGSSVYDNLSMHPTVFGDAYGNAGFFGAFIYSFALALYFSLIEKFQVLSKDPVFRWAAFSIVAVNCLTFARGAVYNAFMFSFLALILTAFFVFVFKLFIGIRRG